MRWVGWAFSFGPLRGDGDVGIGPRQDCPGITGSFADQGTSSLGSQFGWHQLLGSHSQRTKRLQRASAPPAVPPPSADSCPHSALERQLLSGKCEGLRRGSGFVASAWSQLEPPDLLLLCLTVGNLSEPHFPLSGEWACFDLFQGIRRPSFKAIKVFAYHVCRRKCYEYFSSGIGRSPSLPAWEISICKMGAM